MSSEKLLDVLNNLCNMFIDDGQVHEEVIDMLVDAGCDSKMLKQIGFTDDQIHDYAYYVSNLTGQPEEDILSQI